MKLATRIRLSLMLLAAGAVAPVGCGITSGQFADFGRSQLAFLISEGLTALLFGFTAVV